MNMKKLFTKTFALIMMGIFATTMAFAQMPTAGGHDYSNVIENNSKGSEWNLFHFPVINADGAAVSDQFENIWYYNGGHFDNVSIEKFYGHHWRGHTIDELEAGEQIYFCNVKTGEYLQIGDYWGEAAMTNHAGIEYTLENTTLTRAAQNRNEFKGESSAGYWICPNLAGSDYTTRAIGRTNKHDGPQGHFERNKYFALREKYEYDPGDYAHHYGAFVFKFEKVEKGDGKIYYIIYTHRQTEKAESTPICSEFWDRDSYLLLRSAGPLRTGYNAVRWKKFAGQMYGKPGASTVVTISNQTDLPTITDDATAKSTAAHKFGTYDNANGGTTFTTNATSGLEGVTVSISNGTLGAGYYGSNGYFNFNHTMELYPPLSGNGTATLTITAPTGYVITAYKVKGVSKNGGGRQFKVVTPRESTFDWINGADGRCNITESGYNDSSISLTLSTTSGSDANTPLCFPQFSVTLKKVTNDWPNTIAKYSGSDEYKNAPMYDELDYCNADGTGKQYVSFKDALDPTKLDVFVGGDDANLWKIVTKTEREKYRLVASEDKPIDMTYRIKNPKFYTSYTYTFSKNDAGVTWASNEWEHPNGSTPCGWRWFDGDRIVGEGLDAHHHIHPRDLVSGNNGYYNPEEDKKEFHKIGTGLFYRYHVPDGGYSYSSDKNEFMITQGQEANYMGSIWKGTADVIQTIGTGTADDPKLREGLYLVCVKGFFAPHDMMKYDGEGNCDGSPTTSAAAAAWKDQAIIGTGANAKWRRSHDSYLFAWSRPDGSTAEEVRRMLPSVYEGMVRPVQMNELSKEDYINNSEDFKYTQLGAGRPNGGWTEENQPLEVKYMRDKTNFAKFNGAFFGGNSGLNYNVPKTLIGAGRWFNAIDGIINHENPSSLGSYANAAKYRIALPVYVGNDGMLTIGVDHTRLKQNVAWNDQNGYPQTIYASGEDEWVCFDDFELIYLGKVEPEEFVMDELHGRTKTGGPNDPDFWSYNGDDGTLIKEGGVYSDDAEYNNITNGEPLNTAEVVNQNNTQWIDLFDPSDIKNDPHATTVKNLIIRRTMTKDGWNSIVFPMSLTGNQIKEGFGENAKVAYLTSITDHRGSNNTIEYTLVNLEEEHPDTHVPGDKKVIVPGQPYVIKPSIEPMIDSDNTLSRTKFTLAYSTSARGVANWYLKNETRNKQVERKLQGPIYIIQDVEITASETFPDIAYKYDAENDQHSYTGNGNIWCAINDNSGSGGTPSVANRNAGFGTKKIGLFQVMGKPESEKYNLMETAHYYGGTYNESTGVFEPGRIPAYSYFHTNGQIYYTQKDLNTNKGFYAYLQLIHQTTNEAYTKPFIGGTDIFIPVIEEDIDGIEDVNIVPDLDGNSSMVIYDLMGRKVTNPRRGGIYIMNGVKVLFK